MRHTQRTLALGILSCLCLTLLGCPSSPLTHRSSADTPLEDVTLSMDTATPLGKTYSCTRGEQQVYTDPGKVSYRVPVLAKIPDGGESLPLAQSPAPGTRLPPGTHPLRIYDPRSDKALCEITLQVILDKEGGAYPEFTYLPAGGNDIASAQQLPALELGPLQDEFGHPITMSIKVDGHNLPDRQLSSAASLYAQPGFHLTEIAFLDTYGRLQLFVYPRLTTAKVSPQEHWRPGTQEAIGVAKNCHCEIEIEPLELQSISNKERGDNFYHSTAGHRTSIYFSSSKLADADSGMQSRPFSGEGFQRYRFAIACFTQDTQAAQGWRAAENYRCTSCCPKPVIALTTESRLSPIRVYADDGDDSANMEVKVGNSGVGSFSLRNAAATGMSAYSETRGFVGGIEGSFSKAAGSPSGGGATGSLTVSASETYSGNRQGWYTSPNLGPYLIEGRKPITGQQCTVDNILTIDYAVNLRADGFFETDTSTADTPSDSYIYIPRGGVDFICNGDS